MNGKNFRTFLERNTVVPILVVILVLAAIFVPDFLTVRNLLNVLNQNAIKGIMAIGMTFVIINGYFDMSLCTLISLTAALSCGLQASLGLVPAILISLLVGIVVGAINGFLVAKAGINAFVVTLALMLGCRSLSYLYSQEQSILATDPVFIEIGLGRIGNLTYISILFIVMLCLAHYVLRYTSHGRNTYATGGNASAAFNAGIPVTRTTFKDISFHVRRREVVGFYGLVGAGRSEIMETIFGVRRPDAGDIYMNGKKSSIRTSVDAVKNKIGFVTENRKEQGLVLDKSCRENIALAKLPWISKGGFVDDKATYDIYNEYHDKLRISSPSSEQQIVYLSGGNQQKVVIGKWLTTEPDLLILDEPTRGIDVGSKSEIHKLIADLAESGMAVIVISSEMPEIMGVSNRIYTIAQGLITGELTGDEITEENLIKAITITESAKHA